MLSAKYHITYSAVSASTVAAYGLATKLGCNGVVVGLLLVPLSVHMLHVVWKGPRLHAITAITARLSHLVPSRLPGPIHEILSHSRLRCEADPGVHSSLLGISLH